MRRAHFIIKNLGEQFLWLSFQGKLFSRQTAQPEEWLHSTTSEPFRANGNAGCLELAMTILEDTGKLMGNGGAASVLRKYRYACVIISLPDPAVIDN